MLAAALLLFLAAPKVEITLVAFSDYHSHALPFYSEGAFGQGGIARAIAFLKAARARPGTLVFSGGDMLNKDTPAWSDEYGCVEWPWLAGLVDAMALGNHDLDYGPEAFARCRAQAAFPVLAANLLRDDGTPYFAVDGKPYLVKEEQGIRLGVFALGGPDVQGLIAKANLPPGTHWADAGETARKIVAALRGPERANAVILIGHQRREEDEALARSVPGIDLILGTHSHYRGELQQIPGSRTWFISPFQYLAYLSETRLAFAGGRLAGVRGRLVKLDASQPEDAATAAEVARLQAALEAKRPERFRVLGRAAREISDARVADGECALANWATDRLRAAAGVHAFFTTASSFRAAIPPGDVTLEGFLAAIPYKNQIVTAEMTGAQLAAWLALAASRLGSDGFSPSSGVRYVVRGGRAEAIEVLRDQTDPARGFAPLDPAAIYRIGITDFQAFVAQGYKELFLTASHVEKTGLDVQEILKAALARGDSAPALDGRIRVETR